MTLGQGLQEYQNIAILREISDRTYRNPVAIGNPCRTVDINGRDMDTFGDEIEQRCLGKGRPPVDRNSHDPLGFQIIEIPKHGIPCFFVKGDLLLHEIVGEDALFQDALWREVILQPSGIGAGDLDETLDGKQPQRKINGRYAAPDLLGDVPLGH